MLDTIRICAEIFNLIVLPVLSYFAWVLRDINLQLRKINGRVIGLEEWHRGHDKLDDGRFEQVNAEVLRLRDQFDRGRL